MAKIYVFVHVIVALLNEYLLNIRSTTDNLFLRLRLKQMVLTFDYTFLAGVIFQVLKKHTCICFTQGGALTLKVNLVIACSLNKSFQPGNTFQIPTSVF